MPYDPILPRARLGFIIPSSNRMVEPQIARHVPAGVVPHFQRIGMTNRHRAPIEELMPRITYAAEMLGDSKCDVTVLQCTGTSMSGGPAKEKEVLAAIEATTGRPALSAASSLMSAFAAIGARRLAVISENEPASHAKKVGFLRDAGFEIVADKAADLAGTDVYCTTPSDFWFDAATEIRDDRAQAYVFSCANLHTMEFIPALEAKLDRPVISSNQAALWCALRTVGIKDNVTSLGRLFLHDLSSSEAMAV